MNTQLASEYFPRPESQGGWRYLCTPEEVRGVAGMDPEALDKVRQHEERHHGCESWSIVIVRRGYLVREYHTYNVLANTRFDIWSGTKSFTGTAWGLLLDDSLHGKLAVGRSVELDSPAYPFIPAGYPLTDDRKERITIRHLLSMTSGIVGEGHGLPGTPTQTQHGPFEFALGRMPNRFGKWADQLFAEPGTAWEYSDPAISHLALAFAQITGREMSDFLAERVLAPIGIENLSWDVHGGGGFIGPHTNAHTGVHISARELARFGYLMLKRGAWEDRQLVPEWWLELATRPSQSMNANYGYTWWVNANGMQWPAVPTDAFALAGYRSNYCCIIPSLDLVVARVATGPGISEEHMPILLKSIVGAVIAE